MFSYKHTVQIVATRLSITPNLLLYADCTFFAIGTFKVFVMPLYILSFSKNIHAALPIPSAKAPSLTECRL